MKINTRYHGEREYKENEIIYFKNGLPGFEDLKKFISFPIKENELFSVLHSIEDEEIGIVTVSPFEVDKEYKFKLEDEVINDLKISSPDDIIVAVTVTLHSKVENITVNMRAPIIININENLGEQIILDNDSYSIKHPLIWE